LTFDEVFAWVRDALHASLAGEKREHEAAIGWLRAEYESAHCEQMLSALPRKRTSTVATGMSVLCQKLTQRHQGAMSALPPKADIGNLARHVRFVPILLQKSVDSCRAQ
jgi:hypothetical protein